MILTTKGRYGLKAAFDIALNGQTPVSAKSIAARQGISESYLELLISALKKGGIVVSTRGSSGGYVLSRTPDRITAGEILRALEGPLAPAECVLEGFHESQACAHNADCIQTCGAHSVLMRLYENINSVLDSVTLQTMLDDYAQQRRTT